MEPPQWAGENFVVLVYMPQIMAMNKPSSQTFFPMFEKRGGAWYAWLFLQGIQEEADRYLLPFGNDLWWFVVIVLL